MAAVPARAARAALVLALLVTLAVFACGCGGSATTTTVASVTGTSAAAAPAATLELVGQDGTSKTLTMDDVKNLPSVEGYAGIKSSTGKITPPAKFKAVAVTELAKLVGGLDDKSGVSFIGSDGYEMTMSAAQITGGSLIAYDVATGDEKKLDEQLVVALAYEVDGKPLNQQSDGDFRLVALTQKNNQVTDGHWSVKWITKVQVKTLGAEWSLHLKGAIEDTVDRGSFESCAAANCHGVTWKDDKAQEWSGVPLYLLVGRVDDTNKHGTGAFNRELATKGYQVEVVGSDGAKVTLDAAQILDRKDIMVAVKVNGNPLGEQDFPLRLVGAGLQGSDMVGKITDINVMLP